MELTEFIKNNLRIPAFFKAWHISKKRMEEVHSLSWPPSGLEINGVDSVQYILIWPTGVRDKNRKWIFVGDIVKHELSPELGIIQYEEGCFKAIKPKFEKTGEMYYTGILPDYEVIGNIYENKELLETVNK